MSQNLQDVIVLLNHIARKWGGQVVMAERTDAMTNECLVCVDVRDNVMVAQRERVAPMVSHIRTAVGGHFPSVVVEEVGYQGPMFDNGLHKVYLEIREIPHRPHSWADFLGRHL
jgi:hypothetical protein